MRLLKRDDSAPFFQWWISIVICLFFALNFSACQKSAKQKEPEPNEDEKPAREETYKEGESFWGTSIFLAKQVVDYYEKSVCFSLIAENFADVKKFDWASSVNEQIEDDYTRAQSTGHVIMRLLENDKKNEGLFLLNRMIQDIEKISDPMEKATLLTLYANACQQAGLNDKADELRAKIKGIMNSVKTNFPSDNPPPNPSSGITSEFESAIDDVRVLANDLDFIGALNAVKLLTDRGIQACALSYIAYVKDKVASEITDEEVAILQEIMSEDPKPAEPSEEESEENKSQEAEETNELRDESQSTETQEN